MWYVLYILPLEYTRMYEDEDDAGSMAWKPTAVVRVFTMILFEIYNVVL